MPQPPNGKRRVPGQLRLSAVPLPTALKFGDLAFTGFDWPVGLNAEQVVPHAHSHSHLVVLQQVRVDEDAQRRRVTKRSHATVGLLNATDRAVIRDTEVSVDPSVGSLQPQRR